MTSTNHHQNLLEGIRVSTVRVTVAYFARARECAGTAEEELDLTEPASVQQLFSKVMDIHPSLAEIKQTLHHLVNGRWVPEETKLREGDRIAFLPPVGGGSCRIAKSIWSGASLRGRKRYEESPKFHRGD
jgi:MoaD family protein